MNVKVNGNALHSLRFRIAFSKGLHCHALNLLLFQRSVRKIRCTLSNLVNDLHAFDYLAKSSVSTVQMRAVFVHDEELAACGIRHHASSHREYALCVLQIILEAIL